MRNFENNYLKNWVVKLIKMNEWWIKRNWNLMKSSLKSMFRNYLIHVTRAQTLDILSIDDHVRHICIKTFYSWYLKRWTMIKIQKLMILRDFEDASCFHWLGPTGPNSRLLSERLLVCNFLTRLNESHLCGFSNWLCRYSDMNSVSILGIADPPPFSTLPAHLWYPGSDIPSQLIAPML